MKTYLQDAADAGARFVVGARAERILVEDGRATGVQATVTHADGSTTTLTVEAPTVVVACGSVESPALLLRSGIGGPAAGKHLRLHPGLPGQRRLRASRSRAGSARSSRPSRYQFAELRGRAAAS